MNMWTRIRALSCLGLALAVGLTACGGDDDGSSGATGGG